ncbi:MAG: hypothetical protein COX65_08465 [Elusimicrobia bacterium CG_4_10_14_0_2_um_filter_56_8]|nr:MAG: hypothetical protein AUJ51_06260 [Elusimicrobia bacterium CG1_02_56_21]PJA12463.1 MAG: hypothetical protein COX65_08465 [Elusimicrobia bacterium CG_4_10_14_0_2_um_filter_56_8]
MKVFNKTKNILVSAAAARADTFSARLFGLIPRKSLGEEEGLWLEPCAMIHMCFMSFAIDAVFLDGELRVLRIVENFRPWRFSPWVAGARGVLELPAGRCSGRIAEGDLLELQ